MFYQTAIMTYKIMKTGTPAYLADRMRTAFPYNTRQATTGAIRFGEEYSSKPALNKIPGTIRGSESLHKFKAKIRTWVKENIPMK